MTSDSDDRLLSLTRNQRAVLDTLTAAQAPLSAYAILDALRDQGFRGPPQVYRALDKLMQLDLVHRLESLNAFVACSHPDVDAHETTMFLICERCGQASEHAHRDVGRQLRHLAKSQQFALERSTVELRGRCRLCAAKHNSID